MRGIAAVFWPQFHAQFHKTLKINVLQNKAWPRRLMRRLLHKTLCPAADCGEGH